VALAAIINSSIVPSIGFYAGSQAFQLGNLESEALASREGKLDLPQPNSQAGAWELENMSHSLNHEN
jgi:hypothetical protein